jgi:acyl carrier protein
VTVPLFSRIQRSVADVFEVSLESVRPESSPDTIATWDSLRHLNLVLTLEQDFGVQFAPEEIEQLLSVELIEALIDEKLKACGVSQ